MSLPNKPHPGKYARVEIGGEEVNFRISTLKAKVPGSAAKGKAKEAKGKRARAEDTAAEAAPAPRVERGARDGRR